MLQGMEEICLITSMCIYAGIYVFEYLGSRVDHRCQAKSNPAAAKQLGLAGFARRSVVVLCSFPASCSLSFRADLLRSNHSIRSLVGRPTMTIKRHNAIAKRVKQWWHEDNQNIPDLRREAVLSFRRKDPLHGSPSFSKPQSSYLLV